MASVAFRHEQSIRRAVCTGSWHRLSAYLLDELRNDPERVGLRPHRWYSGGHPFQSPFASEKDKGSDPEAERKGSITENGPEIDAVRDAKRDGMHDAHVVESREGLQTTPSSAWPTSRFTQTSGNASLYQKHIRPYLQLSRIDKPIGTWLLLWPSWWSICLATPAGLPDLATIGMFGAGAVLLRGAGCTVNDMWDRDFDRAVERTKTRPLASGALTQGQAFGWLAVQLSAGLGILLQLPPTSQIIGAASLPFVAAYPLMKRFWGWPQAFLGVTINWGAMMGWAAIHDSVDWSVVGPLYASGFFWTLVYDTVYAHQDKKDDVKVGVKSTALTFGDRTKPYLIGFSGANIACLASAGAMAGCHAPFYAGVAAAAAHLAWQVGTVDLDDADDCMAKFKSNFWYGLVVCAGIVADKLVF